MPAQRKYPEVTQGRGVKAEAAGSKGLCSAGLAWADPARMDSEGCGWCPADGAFDLARSGAWPACGEQVLQDGYCDPAAGGLLRAGQHSVGGYDLVPGGFQGDGEGGPVRVGAGN